MENKKKISIVSGCFNEDGNLQEFYDRIIKVMGGFPQYSYEIIIADNCSTDGSRDILRRTAAMDKNFKVILNSNNFGPVWLGVAYSFGETAGSFRRGVLHKLLFT